jgi:uncharacterized protein YuzE
MPPRGGMTDCSAARLSDHARTAMARRAISEAQVRVALRAPQAVVPANRLGRVMAQGPVTLGDPPLEALLRVVVEVGQDPPGVVKGVRDHPVQAVRSEALKITYDAATDTLTVVLRDAPPRISAEEKSGVILDYDTNGRLIALEVLDASARVDGVDTVQLQVIPKPGVKQPAAAE